MPLDPLPPPNQLFRLYDEEKLTREEFHAAMRQHQEALIEEMEEAHQNPLAAAFEEMRRRFSMGKLLRRFNEDELRGVFAALAELPDFPPAVLLWNAAHRHVPIHTFLRPGQEPVFRVPQIDIKHLTAHMCVEYGSAVRGKAMREEIHLERPPGGAWSLQERREV